MYSPALQAVGSTLFISLVPITFLFLIPVASPTKRPAGNYHSHSPLLQLLLSFAVGSLLGDVFIHLIPHSFSEHSHSHAGEHAAHGHAQEHLHIHSKDADGHSRGLLHQDLPHDHSDALWKGLTVLLGFFIFVTVELSLTALSRAKQHRSQPETAAGTEKDLNDKDLLLPGSASQQDVRQRRLRGCSSDPELRSSPPGVHSSPSSAHSLSSQQNGRQISTTGYLNLLSDFLHNFTDGLAIAVTYFTSPAVGFSTTIAIFFHEVPHEVSDFAILLSSGFSKSEALLAQVFTAIGAMLGTVCGIAVFQLGGSGTELSEAVEAFVLPFTAGGFLFIATRTLFGPELGLFNMADSHSHSHGSHLQSTDACGESDNATIASHHLWTVASHVCSIAAGVGLMTVLSLYE